jgi:hypothetical protein
LMNIEQKSNGGHGSHSCRCQEWPVISGITKAPNRLSKCRWYPIRMTIIQNWIPR